MDCCPTTVSNVAGLYLRAETTKFSIQSFSFKCENKYIINLFWEEGLLKRIVESMAVTIKKPQNKSN
jgi:hypothetical protein